jgi:pimeloyl-ACP methyl ester carboxylesterase
LGVIRCPTLVVMGERDRTVPRAAGEQLAREIPGARALIVADSGHATPMDQAVAFNAAVLGFLTEVEQRARSAQR